jgi:hypothetical protein
MQISSTENINFEKPFRNLTSRTKVNFMKKKFLGYLQNKLVPCMLSHCENVRTSKFWQKSKEKKRNFFQKFTRGIKRFDLGQEKLRIISCLCTFNSEHYATTF